MDAVWAYVMLPETCSSPELGSYLTYGIQILRKTERGFEVLEHIHDITLEAALAKQLTELFFRNQLSPVHIWDVLADMLP